MDIQITNIHGTNIAEIISETCIISTTQDALDLMADCRFQGAMGIIMKEHNLIPGFFELKTGIAGDILQKFSNYRMQLAIIGDFSKYQSRSLRDFIYETNKGRTIYFAGTMDEARKVLSEN